MKHFEPFSIPECTGAIVLANGAFPCAGMGLEVLSRWSAGELGCPLIACDGAVNKLRQFTDRLPEAVVGDLDSIEAALLRELGDRVVRVAEQDTNDLTKAMHYVSQSLGLRDVVLVGASGGREDHMLANLALLPTYHTLLDKLVMLGENGYFRLITEDATLSTEAGQQISVFNFAHSPISLSGVHWPLSEHTLPELWCGSLNRTSGRVVTLRTASPVLLYLATS